jgi:hypothetical protein
MAIGQPGHFLQCIIEHMGIIVNQEDNRTELQKRIAAELTDKDKKRKARTDKMPDGVDDSAYIEGTKQTTSLAWVWIVIVVVAVIAAVGFIVISGKTL